MIPHDDQVILFPHEDNCIQGIFHMPPWPNFPPWPCLDSQLPSNTELSLLCHNDESGRTLRLPTTYYIYIYVYIYIHWISIYHYLSLSIIIYLYLSLSIITYHYLSLSIIHYHLSIIIYHYLSLSVIIYHYLSSSIIIYH